MVFSTHIKVPYHVYKQNDQTGLMHFRFHKETPLLLTACVLLSWFVIHRYLFSAEKAHVVDIL